jgi:hypothetical protein
MTAMDPKTPTISRGRKLVACLPFFLVVGLVINTWCKFYRHEYDPSLVHYVTLALVAINGILLVIRFKPGLLLTGVILLFAAFGLLHFFEYTSSFLTFFGITIPFEGWSFLIFLCYIFLNCGILVAWQSEAKHRKQIE